MDDGLIAYIRARLNESENIAKNAIGSGDGNWTAKEGQFTPEVHCADGAVWERDVPSAVWLCDDYSDEEGCAAARYEWMQQAIHIARQDPATVLADIAVKRRILDAHPHRTEVAQDLDDEYDFGCRTCHYDSRRGHVRCRGWCDTVRLLASPYRHLPGFKEDWLL